MMNNKNYPVVEMFKSIQGEGMHLGLPAIFIRLAGCNLNCPWCDTDFSKPREGYLTAEDILTKAKNLSREIPLIVITGGEPLLHDVDDLIIALRTHYSDKDTTICFETNGTMKTPDKLKFKNIWITCSPKPQNNWKISHLCIYDELKYVIDDVIELKDIDITTNSYVWLQPEGYHMQQSWKKCYQYASMINQNNVRVGVQLHKIMEVK